MAAKNTSAPESAPAVEPPTRTPFSFSPAPITAAAGAPRQAKTNDFTEQLKATYADFKEKGDDAPGMSFPFPDDAEQIKAIRQQIRNEAAALNITATSRIRPSDTAGQVVIVFAGRDVRKRQPKDKVEG